VQLGGKKGLGAQKVATNFSDLEIAAMQRDKEAQAVSVSSSQPTVNKSADQPRYDRWLVLYLLYQPSLYFQQGFNYYYCCYYYYYY